MMRSTARRGMFRAMRLLVFAIGWFLFEASAHAEGAIMFVGKIAPHERGVIKTTIEDTAKQLGWSFAERSFPEKDSDDILACLKIDRPSTCIDRLLHANGIDQLAVVQVGTQRRKDGKPDVVVTQQVVAPGADVVFIQRRTCERCDDEGLRQQVMAMTKKLLEDAASGTSKTILAIKSDPPGAWITLDGDTAGATDSTLATYPGKHTVMLRAVGYETMVRDVTAAEGKTSELVVKLRSNRPPAGKPELVPDRDSRVVPWGVVGSGAAAVIAGGVMIAVDEDFRRSGKQEASYRDTAPGGVAIAAVGIAALGIGIYLVVRKPKRTTSPTVSVTSGAAVIGWAGSF